MTVRTAVNSNVANGNVECINHKRYFGRKDYYYGKWYRIYMERQKKECVRASVDIYEVIFIRGPALCGKRAAKDCGK